MVEKLHGQEFCSLIEQNCWSERNLVDDLAQTLFEWTAWMSYENPKIVGSL